MPNSAANAPDRRARRRLKPRRLSSLVFGLAFLLIALSSAALVHVGNVATRAADAQAVEAAHRLFANAIRDRKSLMGRDQLSLARWTKSYRNIAESFNADFVRDEFVDSLWSDFGHDRSYLISGGRQVMMSAREDKARFVDKELAPDDPLRILAERSIARFMANRKAIAGGFTQRRTSAAKVDEIAEYGFAMIDGQPALASAMAIVPDDDSGIAMPDSVPVVLISARFLGGDFLRELNTQLEFAGFRFVPGRDGAGERNAPIRALDGSVLGAFHWDNDQPGARLWAVIIPVIVLLALALFIAAFLLANRLGGISQALEASERRNRDLALTDALSGLANRLAFNRSLAEAIATAQEAPFAVIGCDLDRFKRVNDTYGHAGGDTVIRTVAKRLVETIATAGMVARVGGDEFVILIGGFTDRPRLTVLAHQIIARVCEPIALADGAVTDVGVSLGIAVAPDQGASEAAIMVAADAALYAAKERGRGMAVFAHDLPRTEAALATPTAETTPHAA
jgi:diguanylate cyclase (GGDEF)-like protein